MILYLLHIAIILPILGFVISLVLPSSNEKLLSRNAYGIFGLELVVVLVLAISWIYQGMPVVNIKELVLFRTADAKYEYFIDFYFDKISMVYALVGAFLTFLVAVYSRVYLHREPGYKRFFNTVHLLFVGYVFIIFSGNLETLFIGWELIGISSFLLIAFYRNRYLPVRNAFKVYSIYRLGDIGLILAMWASHHLFMKNITFLGIATDQMANVALEHHTLIGVFISVMLLTAAAVKSAQLPFSSWLPRAMEGPTPSSAIFYGSLSVHLGVFLLLRTHELWEHQISVRIMIGVLGLLTAAVATGIGRVQSSVKTQVAYSSIVQIGLIFAEVAAGFEWLALIHFAGNAFLRTYQLLVSPSVVTYLIREQFYNYTPRAKTMEDSLPKRIMYTLYMLSLKEWNLDQFLYKIYREPVKRLGRKLAFVGPQRLVVFMISTLAIGAVLLLVQDEIPATIKHLLPATFSIIGLGMVLRAYVERKNAMLGWMLVLANHAWIALAVSFNEAFTYDHTILYLSGIFIAGIVGIFCLKKLEKLETNVNLDRHQGYSYDHDKLGFVFFLACLGVTGFPITASFVGEDLIFTHIHEDQWGLATVVALSLIFDGLAIIRIYSKIFMGTHIKGYHEVAYASS
jgi:NADH-quinone oxidoreductase subunit L